MPYDVMIISVIAGLMVIPRLLLHFGTSAFRRHSRQLRWACPPCSKSKPGAHDD